ncbi:helix-turn-helix domain-containing protein [Actinocrispum wychmicini]|uniref:Helix-turn-helix protein n=1 Tax=Actinocrispum wychmicini TaxID=1213861 RepID=A0A4R2JJQ4_9PSEU|nr:helix-turn-helix transcriptional regulator [Actinocrispum wychmicini]TCO56749.1 helix-turn-helix protein [Actinocrispum wychmicini]
MGIPGKPNYYGRQLVRRLRNERERAGLTQEEAGEKLHLRLQKLSRIENGQLPGYHELMAILALYGASSYDCAAYARLWERAKERGWWRKYGLEDSTYIAMEHEAESLVEFQLGRIPELLQIAAYARECVHGDEKQVKVRMKRQDRVLGGENPLVLHSLIHEPVLRQGVEREQLAELIERCLLPNVTVQVVPQSVGSHPGLAGSVTLLAFDDPEEPRIAFARTPLGMTFTQDEDVTTGVHTELSALAERSMSPEDSLDLLVALAG